jgi:hypothetical protein
MRSRLLLLLVLIPLVNPSLQAGILFGRKKDKPDPQQRVPELIAILKSDKDADKRSKAAEELRLYDPAQFPQIVPALIDALQNDAKPGVRVDAAQSLGKLRPVSQMVGEALEQALAKDPSMRVRLQARSTLLQYHWAGYRSAKKTDPPPLSTTPPGGEKGPPAVSTTGVRAMPQPLPPSRVTTKEPPLAPPLPPQLSPAVPTPPPVSTPPAVVPPPPATPPTPPPPSGEQEEGPRLP